MTAAKSEKYVLGHSRAPFFDLNSMERLKKETLGFHERGSSPMPICVR